MNGCNPTHVYSVTLGKVTPCAHYLNHKIKQHTQGALLKIVALPFTIDHEHMFISVSYKVAAAYTYQHTEFSHQIRSACFRYKTERRIGIFEFEYLCFPSIQSVESWRFCTELQILKFQIRSAQVWGRIFVPLPHLNLHGHEMEMPRPPMVITLKLHPFHISHLFLNVKWHLPHLNFDFQHLYPMK